MMNLQAANPYTHWQASATLPLLLVVTQTIAAIDTMRLRALMFRYRFFSRIAWAHLNMSDTLATKVSVDFYIGT